jgi:hypothetical protein
VWLYGAGSPNKVTQTLLEMVRGGAGELAIDLTVYHEGPSLDAAFLDSLPFTVRALPPGGRVLDAVREGSFDYVMLFESSGMYRGEDVVVLASHLASGRLDAAWGSRRLSVRDIEASIRFRYQKSPLVGSLSAFGSHVLSLSCLLLYGRYISDTLSAVRAVRVDDAVKLPVTLEHTRVNQYILGRLLRRKAEVLEIPVQFFPISPERVRRTSVLDGLRSLFAIVAARFSPSAAPRPEPRAPGLAGEDTRSTHPAASR